MCKTEEIITTSDFDNAPIGNTFDISIEIDEYIGSIKSLKDKTRDVVYDYLPYNDSVSEINKYHWISSDISSFLSTYIYNIRDKEIYDVYVNILVSDNSSATTTILLHKEFNTLYILLSHKQYLRVLEHNFIVDLNIPIYSITEKYLYQILSLYITSFSYIQNFDRPMTWGTGDTNSIIFNTFISENRICSKVFRGTKEMNGIAHIDTLNMCSSDYKVKYRTFIEQVYTLRIPLNNISNKCREEINTNNKQNESLADECAPEPKRKTVYTILSMDFDESTDHVNDFTTRQIESCFESLKDAVEFRSTVLMNKVVQLNKKTDIKSKFYFIMGDSIYSNDKKLVMRVIIVDVSV